MYPEPIPLWRQKEFLKLWIGQSISEIGSRITREGIPLTAVLVLGASAAQMGVLAAIGGASVLLFSFAAGIIVDRIYRRPVMIAADLARALLLASVPVGAFFHLLSITQLILVAACAGALTVLFDVAYQSYLPSLIQSGELLEGNRLLSISAATAEILGPSLTGVLVKLLSAPAAIFLDALSFVVSAAATLSIRRQEPPPRISTHDSLKTEMLEGTKIILSHPILRALLFRSVMAFLFAGPIFSFYILYAIRVLRFNTVVLGIAIALGGAGSLVGGIFATKISKRLSPKTSFFGSALVIGCTQFLLPLASLDRRYALACVCVQQFVGDFAWTVYFVNETTLRQSVTPPHVLGRVNAAMQFFSRGMLPIGALVGGFAGEAIGITNTLWIGSAGVLLSALWLVPPLMLPIEPSLP